MPVHVGSSASVPPCVIASQILSFQLFEIVVGSLDVAWVWRSGVVVTPIEPANTCPESSRMIGISE